jgi:hypothetical protein
MAILLQDLEAFPLNVQREVHADDDCLWQGFHPIEHLADGTPFRWTGPSNHFTIGIDHERSRPLIFELQCLKSISPSNLENVFVEFDGRTVLANYERKFGLETFRVLAPAREYGTRTKIVFHLQELAFERFAKQESERGRRLGIAFFRLCVLGSTLNHASAESPGM